MSFPRRLAQLLLVVTVMVSLLSRDAPARAATGHWTTHGPWGRMLAVVVDPVDPSTVYIGGVGVYKTTDGGRRWRQATRGLPLNSGFGGFSEVRALAVDPTDHRVVYAATQSGVFRTRDGGARWVARNDGITNPALESMALAPSDPDVLYVGAVGSTGGVFRSTDGGRTWTDVTGVIPHSTVGALVVDPTDPLIVYAGAGGDIFKSTDGGATWRRRDAGMPPLTPGDLVIDPTDHRTLYAANNAAPSAEPVYKSTDGGRSWRPVGQGLADGVYDLDVVPSNPSTLWAGSDGVYRSVDGGATWSRIVPGPLTSEFRVAIDPVHPQTVYAGINHVAANDRALPSAIKITDGGAAWTPVVCGLGGGAALALSVDPTDPSTVQALVDTSPFSTTNGGLRWSAHPDGLPDFRGAEDIAVDPFDGAVVYAAFFPGGFWRSTDGGVTWGSASEGMEGGSALDIAVDSTQPGRLYTTTSGAVWVSTDRAAHWRILWEYPFPSSGSSVSAVTVDPTNADVLWVGTSGLVGGQAEVWRSLDRGRHFRRVLVAPHATDGAVLAITSDPSDPRTVYVGEVGPGPFTFTGAMLKTTDGGETWRRIDQGFDAGVHAIAIDPGDPSRVFAGTDPNGVFSSTDGGSTWTPMNTSLSSGGVRALQADAAGNHLWAATLGGVFEIDLG